MMNSLPIRSTTIGFIGLGIMGKGMLNNLIKGLDECSFVIWNRNSQVSEDFRNANPSKVSIADTPSEVVRRSSVTYSMLSNIEASKAVFDSTNGVVEGVSEGKIIVDCATLSPERMIEESLAVTQKGGKFLEAPVSGSKVPAENGQLIFLCGGDPGVFDLVKPHLDLMGKANYFFGDVGKGSRMKLVVNMVMGGMMASFVEGIKLSETIDTEAPAKLLEVLDLGAMSNPMFRIKGPNILKSEFGPHFPLKHAQKDMRLSLEYAQSQDLKLGTCSAANELFLKAMNEKDAGDEDFSASYKGL